MKRMKQRKRAPLLVAVVFVCLMAIPMLGWAEEGADLPVPQVYVNGVEVASAGQTLPFKAAVPVKTIVAPGSVKTVIHYDTNYFPHYPTLEMLGKDSPELEPGKTSLALGYVYKVMVHYEQNDPAPFTFRIAVDNKKPVIDPQGKYLPAGTNNDDPAGWPAWNGQWVNGVINLNPIPTGDVSTWPLIDIKKDYRLIESTDANISAQGPYVWTPVPGQREGAPASQGLFLYETPPNPAIEATTRYEFRFITFTGQTATKQVTVKFDNRAPQQISGPAPLAGGATAYGADLTYKFSETNYQGTVKYDIHSLDGLTKEEITRAQDVRTVKFTDEGFYRNVEVQDNLGNKIGLSDFMIDKAKPTLPALTAVQMYPKVSGSPVILTLNPAIADGHSYKLQVSRDAGATWQDFSYDWNEAARAAAESRSHATAWDGAHVIGNESAKSVLYAKIYKVVYRDNYDAFYASAIESGRTPEEAHDVAHFAANFNADYMAWNGVWNVTPEARDAYYDLIHDAFFPIYYAEEYTKSADTKTFTIYPHAGAPNGDKVTFRAVNILSGAVSTSRAYTPNPVIGDGPLVLFGDIPVSAIVEDGHYVIGKQVKVSDVIGYADGLATLTFEKKGVQLAADDTLAQGQTYSVKLRYGEDGLIPFTVTVDTTRPNFELAAVTTAKGAPVYGRNTWSKDNVRLTVTAKYPDMAATYYYSIDGGNTWKIINMTNGSYTFAVNCTAGTELERTYQIRATAASGAEAGIQNFQIKIDKTPLTSIEVTGPKDDALSAYSGPVTMTANKPVAYTYTFTAPDGTVTTDVSAGAAREVRQFAETGFYSQMVARDKAGNTIAIADFVIARKPLLVVTQNEEGSKATLSVSNAAPENISYVWSADKGKTWGSIGSEFTAPGAGEYWFRATNHLSGLVSDIAKISFNMVQVSDLSQFLTALADPNIASFHLTRRIVVTGNITPDQISGNKLITVSTVSWEAHHLLINYQGLANQSWSNPPLVVDFGGKVTLDGGGSYGGVSTTSLVPYTLKGLTIQNVVTHDRALFSTDTNLADRETVYEDIRIINSRTERPEGDRAPVCVWGKLIMKNCEIQVGGDAWDDQLETKGGVYTSKATQYTNCSFTQVN